MAMESAGAVLLHQVGVMGFRPAEVASIYEGRTVESAARIARRMAASAGRLEAFDAWIRRADAADVARLIEWRNPPSAQSGPAVLVALHSGPNGVFGLAFHSLGLPLVVFVTGAPRRQDRGIERIAIDDPGSSFAAMDLAVDRLRAGGLVLFSIDSDVGTSTGTFTLLGRTTSFRLGAFKLASLAKVPVRPLTAEWVGGTRPIRVTLHDPVSAEPAVVAAWFERYLTAHPHEYHRAKFRVLLSAPLAQEVTMKTMKSMKNF